MKKVGKSTKKGFTLVELIVVLVILAVLAAMLVPALVGYIDKAKKEKEYQSAATVYAAAQAVITEEYGLDTLNSNKYIQMNDYTNGSGTTATDKAIDLAGLDPASVSDYYFVFGDNHVIGGSGSGSVSLPTTKGDGTTSATYTSPAATGETLVGYVQIGDVVYCLMMNNGTPRWEGVLPS